MSAARKFNWMQNRHFPLKNYDLFMVPKPISERLSISMQFSETDSQLWPQAKHLPALVPHKESQLKLSLETRNRGEVHFVIARGRGILVALFANSLFEIDTAPLALPPPLQLLSETRAPRVRGLPPCGRSNAACA